MPYPCAIELRKVAGSQSAEEALRTAQTSPEETLAELDGLFAEVGKFKFKFKGKALLRGVAKVAKKTVKSPALKLTVKGLAVAYPPVGVPAAAALATANSVVAHAESADRAKRALAQKLCKQTAAAARKGDPDAARGLAVLLVAKRMRAAQRSAYRVRIRTMKAAQVKKRARMKVRAIPRKEKRKILVRRKLRALPRSKLAAVARRRMTRGVLITCDTHRCIPGVWVRRPVPRVHAGWLVDASGKPCRLGCYRRVR
jgi:hypothetical protein